jgi:uncharacterized protein YjbK
MKEEREIELKSVVNEAKYQEMLTHFSKVAILSKPIYKQINYYFDTEDFVLNKQKIVLRLRVKKGKLEITAKLPNGANGLYNDNQELNGFLSGKLEDYCKDGLTKDIDFIGEFISILEIDINTKFNYLGNLETDRTDFTINNDTISIDKNEYNGLIDYEVEWETTNVEYVANEFELLGLKPGNSVSKLQRFLNSLNNQK